jgi:enterochelin esterase family protein
MELAARKALFPVTFRYFAPQAKAVSVTGSFHHWLRHPMRRAVDGYWQLTLDLKRGRYEYRFLVDGIATLDPKSFGTISHPDGCKSSLLEVGY